MPSRRLSLASSVLLMAACWASGVAAWTDVAADPSNKDQFGAHLDDQGGLHFGLHAPEAEQVDLLLFDRPQAHSPVQVVPMRKHADDWRIRITGAEAKPGLLYMYQARGPRAVSPADRYGPLFNENYPLSDPYAYRTQNVRFSAVFESTPFTDTAQPVYAGGGKSVVHDHAGDRFPGHVEVKPEDLIVYEMHVRGFTSRLEGLPPALRGTYRGLAQGGVTTPGGLAAGLDHLAELGVTAVELMPVMEYDEETGNAPGRLNHWGYMTANFFAPEARYAASDGEQVTELKDLVRALHDRGIAVFMDVVYNHTAEGQPWIADGRLAAKCYNLMCSALTRVYRPAPGDLDFRNDTGTGNDVDFSGGDARYTKRLVLDSLAHWHGVYGIDGFRFDLARILADGSSDAADWVDNDPRFAAAHLHAEPWDMSGVWWDFMDSGPWSQANNRWAKWLGAYRDEARLFSQSALRNRQAFKRLIEGRGEAGRGSGQAASSRPWRSVNFVTAHDGYTLRDCTLFNDPDGSHNCWDSGGDEDLRRRRSKLLTGLLLTSHGVPLILQGDEFGRTQSGAASPEGVRNAYNYESATGDPAVDNVTAVDWALKDGGTAGSPNAPAYGRELFNWTRDLIAVRRRWSHFRRADFAEHVEGAPDDRAGRRNDARFTYAWEGPADGQPTQLAVVWWGKPGEPDLMVVYNEHWEPFAVTNLGDWSGGDWRVLARSWLGDDADLCGPADWETRCPTAGGRIEVPGRSMAILVSTND